MQVAVVIPFGGTVNGGPPAYKISPRTTEMYLIRFPPPPPDGSTTNLLRSDPGRVVYHADAVAQRRGRVFLNTTRQRLPIRSANICIRTAVFYAFVRHLGGRSVLKENTCPVFMYAKHVLTPLNPRLMRVAVTGPLFHVSAANNIRRGIMIVFHFICQWLEQQSSASIAMM